MDSDGASTDEESQKEDPDYNPLFDSLYSSKKHKASAAESKASASVAESRVRNLQTSESLPSTEESSIMDADEYLPATIPREDQAVPLFQPAVDPFQIPPTFLLIHRIDRLVSSVERLTDTLQRSPFIFPYFPPTPYSVYW